MTLIELYDDMQNIIANSELADGSPMKRSLAAIEGGVIETLKRNEVAPYWEEGNVYNRESQQPSQNVPASDPAQDMTIARRVRTGLRVGERAPALSACVKS